MLLLCEVSDEFYENPKNFISTMHHVVKEHIVESMSFKRDYHIRVCKSSGHLQYEARLAQSVERKALNLVVVGSNPTVGVFLFF